jgi:hypothetical protein
MFPTPNFIEPTWPDLVASFWQMPHHNTQHNQPNNNGGRGVHYNNRGLFYDPNIIANNKKRNF